MAGEFSWMTPDEFQSAIDEQLMTHRQHNDEQLSVGEAADGPVFREWPVRLVEADLMELRAEATRAGVFLPESDAALRQWVLGRDEERHSNY
jgi:hypothetical protein